MIDQKKIVSLLDLITKSVELAERSLAQGEDIAAIKGAIDNAIKTVNGILFSSEHFSKFFPNIPKSDKEYLDSVFAWFGYVVETLDQINKKGFSLDSEFLALMNRFLKSDNESLKTDIISNLMDLEPDVRGKIMGFCNLYQYLWKTLDPENGIYDAITDRVDVIKKYEKDLIWLYDKLADYRSKNVLYRTLRNWFTYSSDELWKMKETSFEGYYDFDILQYNGNGVMADCGAYTGDTALGYIDAFKTYQRIYCYEASKNNCEIMENNLEGYENIVIRPVAVGKEKGKITFSEMDSSSNIFAKGDYEVDMVSLDEDITEPISFIKMDIEGAEQLAIEGAREHILKEKPVLAISVYHGNHDIIEVPLLINSIRDDYNFYLRYYGLGTMPTEIVLFAE